MDENLALELRPESDPLVIHSYLELVMGHTAPVSKQSVHFLTVQSVSHVGSKSSLTLVLGEVGFPSLKHCLEAELVGFHSKEAVKATLLLLVQSFKLILVLRLAFNRHVHFNEAAFTTSRILIVVLLVLAHVTSSHSAVLLYKPLLELLE